MPLWTRCNSTSTCTRVNTCIRTLLHSDWVPRHRQTHTKLLHTHTHTHTPSIDHLQCSPTRSKHKLPFIYTMSEGIPQQINMNYFSMWTSDSDHLNGSLLKVNVSIYTFWAFSSCMQHACNSSTICMTTHSIHITKLTTRVESQY